VTSHVPAPGDEARDTLLGDPLPPGEKLLWTGAPDVRALAIQVFHLRKILLWFGAIAVWRIVDGAGEGGGEVGTIPLTAELAWIGAVALLATGAVYAFAWAARRTTTYAVTDRRAFLRIGIALSARINLPFTELASVDWRPGPRETGTVTFRPSSDTRLGYLILWPHARPWRLSRPEPAFRCVPRVGALLEILEPALRGAREEEGSDLLEIEVPAPDWSPDAREAAGQSPAASGAG